MIGNCLFVDQLLNRLTIVMKKDGELEKEERWRTAPLSTVS